MHKHPAELNLIHRKHLRQPYAYIFPRTDKNLLTLLFIDF